MINTELFRPWNLAFIAAVTIVAAIIFSRIAGRIHGARARSDS